MLGRRRGAEVETLLVNERDTHVFVRTPKVHIVFLQVTNGWFEFLGCVDGVYNEWVNVQNLSPYIMQYAYPRKAPYQYGSSISPPDVHQLSSPTANLDGSHVPE